MDYRGPKKPSKKFSSNVMWKWSKMSLIGTPRVYESFGSEIWMLLILLKWGYYRVYSLPPKSYLELETGSMDNPHNHSHHFSFVVRPRNESEFTCLSVKGEMFDVDATWTGRRRKEKLREWSFCYFDTLFFYKKLEYPHSLISFLDLAHFLA